MFIFKDSQCEERPELIIVPMVDLMLFLLAFFVLIAGSIIPGLAIKTNPPKTVQKANFHPKKKLITIVVRKDGSIYYGKEKLNFNQLVRLLKGLKRQFPDLSLIIDADKDASVQSLVSVLDAASKAGVNSIGLLAKEEKNGSAR
ncbi:ExbD/TolR family protein [Thermovibrio sp.]